MTAPVARQTRRYERKREEILNAAAHLFNTKSLKGTTLSDVAQAVDLNATSITYYYKKKEDLAAACYAQTIEAINTVLAVCEAPAELEARIRLFFDRYFAMLTEIARGDRCELVNFYELRGFSGPQASAALSAYEDLFKRTRRLIRDKGEAMRSRLENNARTHLFFSLLLWARTWVRNYEAEDYARAGQRMADILLNGLRTAKSEWRPAALMHPSAAEGISEPGWDAYLHAATRTINEKGYYGASVDRIAAKLNVTKGSFYHHITAKDDLVSACFERSFTTIRKVQLAAIARHADGWMRLSSSTAELVRYQLSEEGPLLRYTALAAAPESMRGDLEAAMQRLTRRFAGIIADGIAEGSFRPVDPPIAALMVNGMINAAADLRQWAPGVEIDTAADLYARPLFEGLLSEA